MKKPFSIILVFVLIFTLGSTSAFAADNPFEDQNVVLDTPSLGPGGEPISVLDTLSDVYDLLDDSFDSDDRSDVGQNSNQTDDASLETAATAYIGGDAAANANKDANRLDGNAFEGETTAFEGKSGVVTEVYDNGSVLTTNADGTKEGVDGEGTLVSVDKDGNETYHFNDGTIGIKYTNGRKEQIYEDGSKLIQNADGSMSTYEAAGYYTNLDEDGNVTSVYFENGQRIDIFDENGEFINQEVTIQGDNGETFTYKFDASENENGEYEVKEFSFSADGNGVDFHLFAKGDGNGSFSLDSKSVDGSTFVMTESDGVTRVDAVSGDGVNEAHIFQSADKVSMTFKDETGESSASEIITENGREVSIKISDGSSSTFKTDENGNVISGSLTSADGSYIKMDENGAQFSNTQTGDYFKADKNGAITSVHMTYQSGATYDFSDGTGVLVDKEKGNKVMWTHDEDGSLVIVSPESNYTVDEKGNLFKDGEPVKFNGSFVNVEKGITPDKEAPQSDETDPPQEPSETDEPKEGYWRLKETNVTPGEDEIGTDGYASYYYSASELSHTIRVSQPKTNYRGAGGATLTVTCSAPPQIIRPDEDVVMHLSLDASYSGDYMTWTASGYVQYGAPNDERNAIAYNRGTRFAALEEGGSNKVCVNPFANDNILETTVVHVFDKGTRAGSEMAILFTDGGYSNTLWIYEWVEE